MRRPQGLCGGSPRGMGSWGLWEELAPYQSLKGFLCPLRSSGLCHSGRKENPSHLWRACYLPGAVSSVFSADRQRPCKAPDLSLLVLPQATLLASSGHPVTGRAVLGFLFCFCQPPPRVILTGELLGQACVLERPLWWRCGGGVEQGRVEEGRPVGGVVGSDRMGLPREISQEKWPQCGRKLSWDEVGVGEG